MLNGKSQRWIPWESWLIDFNWKTNALLTASNHVCPSHFFYNFNNFWVWRGGYIILWQKRSSCQQGMLGRPDRRIRRQMWFCTEPSLRHRHKCKRSRYQQWENIEWKLHFIRFKQIRCWDCALRVKSDELYEESANIRNAFLISSHSFFKIHLDKDSFLMIYDTKLHQQF